MARKRKGTQEIEEFDNNADAPSTRLMQCVRTVRVIIEGHKVPSGMRYDFRPGEAVQVFGEDVETLLSMERTETPCCGGTHRTFKLFKEVA